ncbi:YopX family protein [Enterococcus casseliflavus]|uniref:YopX family protein n=1 Tax=Enterococcus casseliflavus TaxID=37734 RepID=UPI00295393F1|nr:YopX family protein [Enterococcus casseliflavus]MDV7737383.1 YopX family protein [Enterococcus casseliflavus]
MVPKFGAWDKDSKVMRSWKDLILEKDSGDDFWLIGYKENACITSFDHDQILMQATGLLNCETEDGKNVEGWEGDIADVGWSEQTGDFNSHRIILKSPFDYSTDEARWLIHAEYIIIRGNIYENPELLEQANEN